VLVGVEEETGDGRWFCGIEDADGAFAIANRVMKSFEWMMQIARERTSFRNLVETVMKEKMQL
jgi:hypothetical protein